jgi:hypothetical protein
MEYLFLEMDGVWRTVFGVFLVDMIQGIIYANKDR